MALRNDEIGGTLNVLLDSGARARGIGLNECIDKIGVENDSARMFQPVRIGAQIEIDHGPRFQPKRADHLGELRGACGLIDSEMQRLIMRDSGCEVGFAFLCLFAKRFVERPDAGQIIFLNIEAAE